MSQPPCMFCSRPGILRAKADGALPEDLHVCEACWKLLKTPSTGLSLIRGQLSLSLRGTMPEAELKKKVDSFMAMLSGWKPRN